MSGISIPPCHYRISVKALIHNEEWKFLLIQEENELWELPGGWLDYGEDPKNCLKREIREEMWLITLWIATEPSYFYTTKSLKWRNIANVLYEVEVENYDFVPSEECRAIWFFTLEEARNLQTYPNIQEFLKHYNPRIHGNQ